MAGPVPPPFCPPVGAGTHVNVFAPAAETAVAPALDSET